MNEIPDKLNIVHVMNDIIHFLYENNSEVYIYSSNEINQLKQLFLSIEDDSLQVYMFYFLFSFLKKLPIYSALYFDLTCMSYNVDTILVDTFRNIKQIITYRDKCVKNIRVLQECKRYIRQSQEKNVDTNETVCLSHIKQLPVELVEHIKSYWMNTTNKITMLLQEHDLLTLLHKLPKQKLLEYTNREMFEIDHDISELDCHDNISIHIYVFIMRYKTTEPAKCLRIIEELIVLK